MEYLFIYLFFSSLFSIFLCFCSQDKIDMTENDYVGLCESAFLGHNMKFLRQYESFFFVCWVNDYGELLWRKMPFGELFWSVSMVWLWGRGVEFERKERRVQRFSMEVYSLGVEPFCQLWLFQLVMVLMFALGWICGVGIF